MARKIFYRLVILYLNTFSKSVLAYNVNKTTDAIPVLHLIFNVCTKVNVTCI